MLGAGEACGLGADFTRYTAVGGTDYTYTTVELYIAIQLYAIQLYAA